MSNLKRSNSEILPEQPLVKKQCLGYNAPKTLLHKLLLHPDLNTMALQCLEMENILSVSRSDQQLFSIVPDYITEIVTHSKGMFEMITSHRSFKRVKKIEILPSCYSYSLEFTNTQFPSLKIARFQQINSPSITISSSTIEDLFVLETTESKIETMIVHPSLLKLTANIRVSLANQLISSQPNLQYISLNVNLSVPGFSSEMRNFTLFDFNQISLRKLQFVGWYDTSVIIHSLQNMEELDIDGAPVLVINYCSVSPMRWMYFSSLSSSFEKITGRITKFPQLNFFHVHFDHQQNFESDALRVYQECMSRDQQKVKPFFREYVQQQSVCYSEPDNLLYCVCCPKLKTLVVKTNSGHPAQSSHIFLQNIEGLQQLEIKARQDFDHIELNSKVLSSVTLSVNTFTVDTICTILSVHKKTLKRVTLILEDGGKTWENIFSFIPNSVEWLHILLLYNHEDVFLSLYPIVIRNLTMLQNFIFEPRFSTAIHPYIISSETILHCSNMPLLSKIDLEVNMFVMMKLFFDRLPSLTNVKSNGNTMYTIYYGGHQRPIQIQ